MNVEIISIGDELLIGRTINTNAAWIGEQLSAIGFEIKKVTTIRDNKSEIIEAITNAAKENDVVLVTGGLGPTKDDITKHTLCEIFDTKLIMNAEALKNTERFIYARGGEMNENNINQALFPETADFIPNYCGSASGMWFKKDNAHVISMPGVPFEMTDMMSNFIIPRLKQIFTLPTILHEHVMLTGIPEAKLAEILEPWETKLPQEIKLAYLPSPGIIKLRLSCFTNTIEKAKKLVSEQIELLMPYVSEYVYGYNLKEIQEVVLEKLIKNKKTLSTAESCTGGNIAHLITSISGSSACFKGGIVAYDNSIKTNLLQVSQKSLDNYGAVSEQVVKEMAWGCVKNMQTDYAISTSGIAGPTGGTEEKPVGTVWIAVANKQTVVARKFNLGENRNRTITRASIAGLNMLRKLLEQDGENSEN